MEYIKKNMIVIFRAWFKQKNCQMENIKKKKRKELIIISRNQLRPTLMYWWTTLTLVFALPYKMHIWYYLKEDKIVSFNVMSWLFRCFCFTCLFGDQVAILGCQYIPVYNVHIRYFEMISCCRQFVVYD